MRFEDLPKAERDALAEYGYEVAAEMEAMDEPAPGDPTLDPRYDPSRELRRLNYQRHALDREIEAAVAASPRPRPVVEHHRTRARRHRRGRAAALWRSRGRACLNHGNI